MSEDNVTVMRGAFEAFNRGDIPQVIGVLDPDVVWHNPEAPYPPPAGGGTQLGVDNVVGAIFGPVPETWDAFQAVAERFLDAGDHVIVTGRFTGRANAVARSSMRRSRWSSRWGPVASGGSTSTRTRSESPRRSGTRSEPRLRRALTGGSRP
jgi:ketosteroid isomerase-like protein